MEYLKEQQAGSRKPKNPGKIRQVSNEAAVRAAKLSQVLDEIDQEREPICQGCGKPEFEHSHSLPRNYRDYAFMADKRNIWRLCRECHVGYENGHVWKLSCGEEIMQNILLLDEQYFRQKTEQFRKRLEDYKVKNWLAISNGTIVIHKWVDEFFKTFNNL